MEKTGSLVAGRPSAAGRTVTLTSLAKSKSLKRVNFDLTAEQHKKLKIYAAKQGKTMAELLKEYIDLLPFD